MLHHIFDSSILIQTLQSYLFSSSGGPLGKTNCHDADLFTIFPNNFSDFSSQEYGSIYTFAVYIGTISIPSGQAKRNTPVNISTLTL